MTRKDRTEGIYNRLEVLDASEREQFYRIQLKDMLKYAYRYSEEVKKRFDRAQFDVNKFKDISDIKHIPILKKKELIFLQSMGPRLGGLLTKDMGKTLTAIAYTAGYGVIFYIPLVYLPNYVHEHIGMDLGLSMQINTIGTFLLLFFIPLFGRLSDTLMRRKTILSLAFAFLVLGSYPLFLLLQQGGYLLILFVQLVFALAIAVPLGVSPALLVELYPAEDRLTGYSLAYNIGLGVVGGTTPMMSAWLINATGSTLAPALYLAGLSVVSLAGVLLMLDRSREELQ